MRSIRTTIAVGDKSARNPRIGIIRAKPRRNERAHDVVTPRRGFFVLSSCPWVPRGLVTHGYGCFGATRLMQHTPGLFRKVGMTQPVSAVRALHHSRDVLCHIAPRLPAKCNVGSIMTRE